MKVLYIAETSLTNKSAYSQHVIKMCDAFGQKKCSLTLVVPHEKNNFRFKNIKNKFLLNSKKPFLIKSILNSKINNFFSRFEFAIKASIFTKSQRPSLIVTRSLLSSFCLSILRIPHFLEIHNEIKSFSKFLFLGLNYINSKYIIKIILISNALKKKFDLNKKKVMILHDGSDPKNFKKSKKINKIKNATYVGSFYQGRGIDLIYFLAKKFKHINFRLYGKNNKNYKSNLKNLKIFKFVEYNKVPSILASSDLLLMPYEKKVFIRAKNINTADYCSPLKMFDYLASGKIIISSNLNGISEVIKNGYNGYLVNNFNMSSWEKKINEIIKKTKRNYIIQTNALNTAEKYSWNNRVKKIIIEYKKNIYNYL